MSKILGFGETGYGILIEQDAGYISHDLNKTILTEDYIPKLGEPILINCILQKWGIKNKNGRIYGKDILVPEVDRYQELVATNSAIASVDHPDCLQASESMICTKDGWKKFEDISDDEEILTLNTDTNKIEIQKIDEKIYAKYKGKMYNFIGNNLELTVTPKHRFLIENINTKIKKYVYAKDIYDDINGIFSSGKNRLLKTADWIGEYSEYFTLPAVEREYLGYNIKHILEDTYTVPINIKSEDWFAFMGIYLSEGHCGGTVVKVEKNQGFDVVITQKKENSKLLIEELLDRLPFEIHKNEGFDGICHYHIRDARLYKYLYRLGNSHEKFIPIELKQSSSNLLEILFKWFLIGDGRSIKIKNSSTLRESVFSVSQKLIYDLKEILLKIGYSGNVTTYQPKDRYIIDKKIINNEIISTKRLIKAENSCLQYNLYVSRTKNIYLDKRTIKITEIDFDDNIACVKVKNSNFYVMVNGKSHWTGNSSTISLENISHLITKMWWGTGEQENVLYGQLRLIVSPGFINYGVVSVSGDKILLYLQYKIRIGISSRGVGSLKEIKGENYVQSDFELIGFDLVSSPSTPGAYLEPLTKINDTSFSENYINKNGILIKEDTGIITALDRFLLV